MRSSLRNSTAVAPGTRRRTTVLARLTLEYWRDGRWYGGQLREMPEVISQGRTLAELRRNIIDAYRLVLHARAPRG